MDKISDYFQKKFFIFVPNICDASCDFCYVQPALSSNGKLADGLLRRLDASLKEFSKLDFREARITGGEPLVFSNLLELIELVRSHSMQWALLTNGIRLAQRTDDLIECAPRKLTVSVHSLNYSRNVFGLDRDKHALLSAMQRFRVNETTVCASYAFLPEFDSYYRTEEFMLEYRECLEIVNEVKWIMPNVEGASDRVDAFLDLTMRLQEVALQNDVSVRRSDVESKFCWLNREASLAVSLPSTSLTLCCATVGAARPLGRIESDSLPVLLAQGRTMGKALREIPCRAHYGACPLALETLTVRGAVRRYD